MKSSIINKCLCLMSIFVFCSLSTFAGGGKPEVVRILIKSALRKSPEFAGLEAKRAMAGNLLGRKAAGIPATAMPPTYNLSGTALRKAATQPFAIHAGTNDMRTVRPEAGADAEFTEIGASKPTWYGAMLKDREVVSTPIFPRESLVGIHTGSVKPGAGADFEHFTEIQTSERTWYGVTLTGEEVVSTPIFPRESLDGIHTGSVKFGADADVKSFPKLVEAYEAPSGNGEILPREIPSDNHELVGRPVGRSGSGSSGLIKSGEPIQ